MAPAEDAVKEPGVEMDFEEALDETGCGKYQIIHCALMLLTLVGSLHEVMGIAFILPAAACDLDVPENLNGIITSIPSIGIILTAPFMGRAADSFGRKPALLFSCAATGAFALISSIMPTLVSYLACRALSALFLSGPSSIGFAYASEFVPRKRRDLAVQLINGFLMLSGTTIFALSWVALQAQWGWSPWRALTALHAVPLLIAAIFMIGAAESPKFLTIKGKQNESINVLKRIYAVNTNSNPDHFSVITLKPSVEEYVGVIDDNVSNCELTAKVRSEPGTALLRPPHLKWLALLGFLMFGMFSTLNGLFLFTPNIMNQAMQDTSESNATICIMMSRETNQTSYSKCNYTVSHDMFFLMVVTTAIYSILVMIATLSPLSKKSLLVGMFLIVGGACMLSNTAKNSIVVATAMSALQVGALGIGPLTAYAVKLFPTSLRGTGVSAIFLLGRIGSVVGANAAGIFLNAACSATFYGFTFLMLLCAALSVFLLPKDKTPSRTPVINDR